MSCDLCQHQYDAEGIVVRHSDGSFSCSPFACPLWKTDGQKCENFEFKKTKTNENMIPIVQLFDEEKCKEILKKFSK